jgi:Bax protein
MKRLLTYCFVGFILSACSDGKKVLKTETILLTNANQIVLMKDSLVKPIVYQNIPSFDHLSTTEAKEKFIATILPGILIAKFHLSLDQEKVKSLSEKKKWSEEDSTFYLHHLERFKAKDLENLLLKMETHPNSITLAQAAVESGWGSSRFFRQANNLFGIWAYKTDEPKIAANRNNVYLRKYEDVSQSIEDYFVTLGRAKPYRAFREAKKETNDINDLLPHLKYYSERGMAYVSQLETVIRQNELSKYDHYQLDPNFIDEE